MFQSAAVGTTRPQQLPEKDLGRHQHRSQGGTRPCDLQGLRQVYDAVCQWITALMLPLNSLPQQPVKTEEAAAD